MDDGRKANERARHAALGVLCGLLPLACGSAPPPAPAPPAPPAAVIATAPDLSEVVEPPHLIGVVRWKNPETTLKTVYEWTGVRISPSDLAAEGLDKSLAATLAFDAPVDAAVALDDKGGDRDSMPFFAVSLGARSLDSARDAAKALGTVTEVHPGEYKINLRNGKKKNDKPFCMLSASIGPTPARFVCGRRERDVEMLRSYMTRTLPKRDFGTADLHVELHMAPAVEVYGPLVNQGLHLGAAYVPRKLEIGEPAFDRALERAAAGLSDELGAIVGDVDSLTVDVAMTPEQATARGTLRLKGSQSWTSGVLASEANRAAAPPPIFWHLPAVATTASYYYPVESRRFEAIRRTLAELMDGWLLHEGMAPADRAPVNALLGDKFTFETPWVSAAGAFPTDAVPVAASRSTPAKIAAAPDPIEGALVRSGWHLFGVGAPNQVSELLKDFSSTLSRPKVQAFLKSKLLGLGSELEQGAKRRLSAITMKPAPAPKELPKGSLAFELGFSLDAPSAPAEHAAKGAKKPAKPRTVPYKMNLVVTPDSTATWIALGSDRALLAKVLQSALDGSPETGTLASRQDIASLKNDKLAAATFTTIENLVQSWSGPWMFLDPDAPRPDASSLLNSTPHKGKTPMVLRSDVKAGYAISWTIRADIPKGVIEDAIILGASSAFTSLPKP